MGHSIEVVGISDDLLSQLDERANKMGKIEARMFAGSSSVAIELDSGSSVRVNCASET
jgi:hypothetical protein